MVSNPIFGSGWAWWERSESERTVGRKEGRKGGRDDGRMEGGAKGPVDGRGREIWSNGHRRDREFVGGSFRYTNMRLVTDLYS